MMTCVVGLNILAKKGTRTFAAGIDDMITSGFSRFIQRASSRTSLILPPIVDGVPDIT